MDLEIEIILKLKAQGFSYALTVPCAKIKRLIAMTSEHFIHIPLSREEEGVGIATGIHLAGEKAILMFQNSGIGNSLNALLSLAKVYRIPMPMIISWRGVYNEKIEAQKPMGQSLPAIFDSVEFPYVIVEEAADLEKISTALTIAYKERTPVGIFISPKLWEQSHTKASIDESSISTKFSERITKKHFTQQSFSQDSNQELQQLQTTHTRMEALNGLKDWLSDKIIVSNIGVPSKELYKLLDQESNFYMLGSFGLASAIGFGLSLVLDREVVVLDGDASFLTNPNIFGTIALHHHLCSKLTILLLDNGVCGSTGNQITAAYNQVNLEAIAQAYGINNTHNTRSIDDLQLLCAKCFSHVRLIHVLLKPGNDLSAPVIPLSAEEIKQRFMKKILVKEEKKK